MLGYDLAEALGEFELIGVDAVEPRYNFSGKFLKLDFTDSDAAFDVVSGQNPDVIVHAGAYTDVDGCERDPEKAYRVNGLGTRNIVVAAGRFDAAVVYISTDYVFDGMKGSPYREDDKVNPVSEYGKSKLCGEKYVQQFSQKYFILRSGWLFGRNRTNFVQSIRDALVSGKTYRAAGDMKGSPTCTQDLSAAVRNLISTRKYGVYHVTNSGVCSRYELGLEIKKLMDIPVKGRVEEVKLDDLKLAAKRPRNSVLENFCYISEGFKPMPEWRDALKRFLKKSVYTE